MASYKNIVKGVFVSRPNRFIANVEIGGEVQTCHVKNTGRCKELLVPGTQVFLEKSDNPDRKTAYDLIAVEKKCENGQVRLINMDSQIPNAVAAEWILAGGLLCVPKDVRREVKFGNSRFDLQVDFGERKAFVEVKGVTLEDEGVVRFPDAPTERGVKHVRELMECKAAGFDAYIIFVVQMNDVKYFEPNYRTHEEFGEVLKEAFNAGVQVLAVECDVEIDSIVATKEVAVRLE